MVCVRHGISAGNVSKTCFDNLWNTYQRSKLIPPVQAQILEVQCTCTTKSVVRTWMVPVRYSTLLVLYKKHFFRSQYLCGTI